MNPALDRIRADLERHRKLFDLREGDLGKALCKAGTDGVQECIDGEHSPDGTPWPPLSPEYEAWKARTFGGQPMGVLHHLMRDPKQIEGVVEVETEKAVATYGVSEEARREAAWFQEGRPPGQPPRPFWGFTERSLGEVRLILDSRFATI